MSRWSPRQHARAIRRALRLYQADLDEYDRRAALYGGADLAPPELRQQAESCRREMRRLEGRLAEIEAAMEGAR